MDLPSTQKSYPSPDDLHIQFRTFLIDGLFLNQKTYKRRSNIALTEM